MPVHGQLFTTGATKSLPETRRGFLPAGFRLFLLIGGVAMLVLVGMTLAIDDDTGTVDDLVATIAARVR